MPPHLPAPYKLKTAWSSYINAVRAWKLRLGWKRRSRTARAGGGLGHWSGRRRAGVAPDNGVASYSNHGGWRTSYDKTRSGV